MNTREIKTIAQITTALTDGGNTLAMRLGSIRAAHVRIVQREHGMTPAEAEQSFAACRDEAEDQIAVEAKQAAEVAEELKAWACKCSVCAPVVNPSPSPESDKQQTDREVDENKPLGKIVVTVGHVNMRCVDWGHLGTLMVKAGVHPLERKRIIKQAKQNGGIYAVSGSIHTIKFVC